MTDSKKHLKQQEEELKQFKEVLELVKKYPVLPLIPAPRDPPYETGKKSADYKTFPSAFK